jgi:hypothetical protein
VRNEVGIRVFVGFLILFPFVLGVRSGQDQVDWLLVRQLAEQFVYRESPPNAWPFAPANVAELSTARKKVFSHYFDPFPLSDDNLSSSKDYFTTQFLTRSGENNKYKSVGGYLRGRPLPVGPWANSAWREINYAIEISRARNIGLDGFVIDILQANSGKYWDALKMLLETGEAVDPEFRFVLEPDMAALDSVDIEELASAIKTLSLSPSVYRLADGRVLVAPFYAERESPDFWKKFITEMAEGGTRIALLPVLLNFVRFKDEFAPFSYGLSSWGERDPKSFATDDFLNRVDQSGAGDLKLMLPIAAQDVRPKSSIFWEARNTQLFRDEWERAIFRNVDYVHIITWNDYSESTEISPSSGTQFVFYDLAYYYAIWFKTGRPPQIMRDAIYYTHRRQIERVGETANPGDIPMRLLGKTPLRNQIEMLAFLTEPAIMEIEIADHRYSKSAAQGLVEFDAPAEMGRPIFRIKRGGRTIVAKSSDWTIDDRQDMEDPTYAGGSSIRPFSDLPKAK